jgi:hypothetical protein
LCDAWKTTGQVDALVQQAMSFSELKQLLGVDRFLNEKSEKRADGEP